MNTQQLDQYGVCDLVEKVLDFEFILPFGQYVCFRDIIDGLDLDISIPSCDREKKLSDEEMNDLRRKVDAITKRVGRFSAIDPRLFINTSAERETREEEGSNNFGINVSHIGESFKSLNDNNGKFVSSLLGSFSATERKIYLYLDSIKRTNLLITYPLIATFVHELFHAWNFFASKGRQRSLREIEEAMVEFGTLLFLKELHADLDKSGDALTSDFGRIFNWKLGDVASKREQILDIVAYGFGFYLYTLSQNGTNETENVKMMLWAYGEKSGRINPADELAKQIKDKLNYIYPIGEEKDVYDLFYDIIMLNDLSHKETLHNATLCGNNSIVSNGKTIFSGFSDWGVLHISYEGKSTNLYVFKVVREDGLARFRFFDESWNEVLPDYTITWFRYFRQAKNGNRLLIVEDKGGKQNLIGLDMKPFFPIWPNEISNV